MQRLRHVFVWAPPPSRPAICHITHPEAGAEWLGGFFHALVPDRVIEPERSHRQILSRAVMAGKVYQSLFLTREQFESTKVPPECRRFVMIRDLRDTLVSLYLSNPAASTITHPAPRSHQRILSEVSKEVGLLHLLDGEIGRIAQMQWSWVAAHEEVIRYEDMREHDEEILAEVLLRRCRIGVDVWHFRETILANRFETWAGCDEEVDTSDRPHVPGNWRRHFTGRVIDQFKKRYGSLLIATGYEKNFRW
ncbi:MAG: hypothetical protein U0792_25295 [Gemmataceae bacterium]